MSAMRAGLLGTVLASLVGATSARAAVIDTGSFSANSSESEYGSTTLGPGAYVFSLQLSTPIVDTGNLYVEKTQFNTYFCNDDNGLPEHQCGGPDPVSYTDISLTPVTPLLYQASVTVDPVYDQPGGAPPYMRYRQTDTCCDYYLYFNTIAAGDFTLSVGSASAPPGTTPEPAAWALMIVGFGGIGAALRRRRGGTAAPVITYA